jgi:hypothetical protein
MCKRIALFLLTNVMVIATSYIAHKNHLNSFTRLSYC